MYAPGAYWNVHVNVFFSTKLTKAIHELLHSFQCIAAFKNLIKRPFNILTVYGNCFKQSENCIQMRNSGWFSLSLSFWPSPFMFPCMSIPFLLPSCSPAVRTGNNRPLSHVFKLMDVSSAKAYSDQPFPSPVSFNMISIAGIHFVYISCC